MLSKSMRIRFRQFTSHIPALSAQELNTGQQLDMASLTSWLEWLLVRIDARKRLGPVRLAWDEEFRCPASGLASYQLVAESF